MVLATDIMQRQWEMVSASGIMPIRNGSDKYMDIMSPPWIPTIRQRKQVYTEFRPLHYNSSALHFILIDIELLR